MRNTSGIKYFDLRQASEGEAIIEYFGLEGSSVKEIARYRRVEKRKAKRLRAKYEKNTNLFVKLAEFERQEEEEILAALRGRWEEVKRKRNREPLLCYGNKLDYGDKF